MTAENTKSAKMKMWIDLKFVAAEVTRLHGYSALRMSLLTSAATNKKSFNILPPD
jgi:hypothetical protein